MKAQRILVTAGSTRVPIDRVRVVTNVFGGQTGLSIANHLAEKGHEVTLLTSAKNPERHSRVKLIRFHIFDELMAAMQEQIEPRGLDVVIHSAAVSDYKVTGTYQTIEMVDRDDGRLHLVLERLDSSGKVGSDHGSLFLREEPTLKIVDLVRRPWGFGGKLVKFKLQVDMSDEELLTVARRSRLVSEADLIVANCLEWMNFRAYIIGAVEEEMVPRSDLPAVLARRLEL